MIERHLRHQEIFSPLALTRKLTTMKNCQVIQMTTFLDYQYKAKSDFNFSRTPYTQVRQLKIDQVAGTHSVRFKLSHQTPEWTTVSTRREVKAVPTRKGSAQRKLP
ncbi:hypothetical protein ElyMa_006817800 [Elysia marginata]|uniref:Uncharacterized protein n=1 Tax=Elysia marginata TaxID=1093978 RepID=A0AAV4J4J5_9GAST|nr:hypothetical protein ElyMa_006817800 [Elysia marginata]